MIAGRRLTLSPVRIGERLRKLDQALAEGLRPKSEQEQREHARRIGAEHKLPDPQNELELR